MKASQWRWMVLTAAVAILFWQRDELGDVLGPMLQRSTMTAAAAQAQMEARRVQSQAASTAESPSTPAAAAAPAGVAAGKSPPVLASAKSQAVPTLSAAEARKAMLERWHDQDCRLAQAASQTNAQAFREQRQWRWLPEARVAVEREAIDAAINRLSDGCPPPLADGAERARQTAERAATLRAAAEAGDLYARLEPAGFDRDTPNWVHGVRATMYDAVLSGDLEAIARLGWPDVMAHSVSASAAELYVDRLELWPLVACDLGLDCGPGSRILDRACMQQGAGCGYPSFEAYARDTLPPSQFRVTDQRRREIVARIRSGQIAGMFDPPPATTAGGKP